MIQNSSRGKSFVTRPRSFPKNINRLHDPSEWPTTSSLRRTESLPANLDQLDIATRSKKIIACFDVLDGDKKKLINFGNEIKDSLVIKTSHSLNEETAKKIPRLPGDQFILSTRAISEVPRKMVEKFKPDLVAIRSVGTDKVDMKACKEHGAIVETAVGYGDNTVAEHAMTMLLGSMKKIDITVSNLKSGIVDATASQGEDLYGKTVGVIGTGKIGSKFATMSKVFGTKVLACDPYPNPSLNHVAEYVDKDCLIKNSDIISLHAPYMGTPILKKADFANMKDGVRIVNVSRGENIDSVALLDALEQGKVKSADLDVLRHEHNIFKNEKPKNTEEINETELNQRLMNHPKVKVTPHFAFNTKESGERKLDISLSNIKEFLKGRIQNQAK